MGSPIEEQLFDALLAAAQSWGRSDESDQDPVVWVRLGHRRRLAGVFRDFPMLTYRIDLLLGQVHGPVMLAIECDGHEFHDRTKQQAAYDRARDRELLLKGVTTIRFTGSEIFHSAERCAHEALDIFVALADRSEPAATSTFDITGAVGG